MSANIMEKERKIRGTEVRGQCLVVTRGNGEQLRAALAWKQPSAAYQLCGLNVTEVSRPGLRIRDRTRGHKAGNNDESCYKSWAWGPHRLFQIQQNTRTKSCF